MNRKLIPSTLLIQVFMTNVGTARVVRVAASVGEGRRLVAAALAAKGDPSGTSEMHIRD